MLTPEDIKLLSCGRHPARVMDFVDLRERLLAEEHAGNVRRTEQDGLELWTYTTRCQFDRLWTMASLIARGLVLDPAATAVVATPFPKFFNWGELAIDLPRMGFEVTEKVDGSLGILFFHGARWRVVTKGSFTSEQSRWAEAWVRCRCRTEGLRAGCTYLVEVVYERNRIVIRYAYEGLVLLAGYDERGVEFSRDEIVDIAAAGGFRVVPSRRHDTVEELLQVAEGLSKEEEGFVVRFANGLRWKIKGQEYCRLHKLITGCTPIAVWEGMWKGESAEAVLGDLPEEFRGDFERIRALLQARLDESLATIRRARQATDCLSPKELGILLQACGPLPNGVECPPEWRRFIFMDRKRDLYACLGTDPRTREAVFRLVRPDCNRLPGYVPSSAMNRFSDADG